MDYKKLLRVIDPTKVGDSNYKDDAEELYFFYDGFDGILEENLTFDDLLEIVKSQLNPEGNTYKEVEENPQAIWDIDWDLMGGDFEQIDYGKMEDVGQYKDNDEEFEDEDSKGHSMDLSNKFKEEVSALNKELGDLIDPGVFGSFVIAKIDLEKLNLPEWKKVLREVGYKMKVAVGIDQNRNKNYLHGQLYD